MGHRKGRGEAKEKKNKGKRKEDARRGGGGERSLSLVAETVIIVGQATIEPSFFATQIRANRCRPIFTVSAMTDRENRSVRLDSLSLILSTRSANTPLSIARECSVLFSPAGQPLPIDRSIEAGKRGWHPVKRIPYQPRFQLLFTRLFVQRQTRSDSDNYWIKTRSHRHGNRVKDVIIRFLERDAPRKKFPRCHQPLSSFLVRRKGAAAAASPHPRVEYRNGVILSTSSFAMMKFHDELVRLPPRHRLTR